MLEGLDTANAWRWYPDTFAQVQSQGRWQAWDYLQHVGRRIGAGLHRGNYRAIVNMPPRHGKSELCSYWIPAWFLSLNTTKNVMLASYEAGFASEWGRKTRDLFLGRRKGVRRDAAGASRWMTPDGGGMMTAGVGGPFTGRGGNLLILDDPHKNWEESISEAKLRALQSWWGSTFLTRGEPGHSILVIHTRWHEEDLTGYLLSEDPDGWDHIVLPAIATEDDDIGRLEGEVLCPWRYTLEDLLAVKKRIGSSLFEAMYQQNPQPQGGSIWDKAWWRRWQEIPEGCDWLQSWDLTFKDTKKSDYVVGQVWAYKGSRAFLVHQERGKWDARNTIQRMKAVSKRFPQADLKLIEDKANGPAVMSMLRGQIGGMVPVEPYGSKYARAMSVQPYVEAGDVYLPADSKGLGWVADFISECQRFPRSKHDDQVDAASQALRRIFTNGGGLLIGSLL